MKPQKRKELYDLIEQHTRCEIMARLHPRLLWTEWGDYYFQTIEKMDQIRKLMFGTSDLVQLGEQWGILQEINQKKKDHKKLKLRRYKK